MPRLQSWRLGTLPRSVSLPRFGDTSGTPKQRPQLAQFAQRPLVLGPSDNGTPRPPPPRKRTHARRIFASPLPLCSVALALAALTFSLDFAQEATAALDSASAACVRRDPVDLLCRLELACALAVAASVLIWASSLVRSCEASIRSKPKELTIVGVCRSPC